jgi:hypothetical protein
MEVGIERGRSLTFFVLELRVGKVNLIAGCVAEYALDVFDAPLVFRE